jgi:hypothetical protein
MHIVGNKCNLSVEFNWSGNISIGIVIFNKFRKTIENWIHELSARKFV